MTKLWSSMSLAALLALAAPGFAQDAPAAGDGGDAGAETSEQEAGTGPAVPPVNDLAMGEEIGTGTEPGTSYVATTHGDWEQRCVRTESGNDPCQLYQLLRDGDDNPVAEISIFALPPGRDAAAGSTIITPLETLLPRQITLAVDSGAAKRYPFEFCAPQGCFSRIGFTEAEVRAFKAGAAATMTIYPAGAPDQPIALDISLSGFTAGYDAVAEANAAAR
ncbi:invasion associated locus B family protein [Palleronia sediminis]|uniref:Invasion associated locus B family protein n=1 Tax=Palleronia sediminis TaxID=2547833 RepID=A0A4R6AI85_9RHOB|nr:invasion associated locus B family protein [Palleronia sediminis]TDL83650.1 invasion associated locus B family protein [Palleronia sediminis]